MKGRTRCVMRGMWTEANTSQRDTLDSRGVSACLSIAASLPQQIHRRKSTPRPTVLLQNSRAIPTPQGRAVPGRPPAPTDRPPHRLDAARSQVVGAMDKYYPVLVGAGRVPQSGI